MITCMPARRTPPLTSLCALDMEALKPRIVVCPGCGGDSVYSSANAFRPFCSERCKGIDLGAWASESFKVAADAPLDDPLGESSGGNGNLLQ